MNIMYLKGIGQVRAKQFQKLKINTVGDLLLFFPRRYEDWQNTVSIMTAPIGETVCIRAIMSCRATKVRTHSGMLITKTLATDGSGIMQLTFFNNPYAADTLSEGEEFLFYGKVSQNEYGGFEMLSPSYLKAQNNCCLHPVYSQTEGLSSRTIAKAVKTALEIFAGKIEDPLPKEQITKYRLPSFEEALRQIHFPNDNSSVLLARRRLIFDELLILQLGIQLSKVKKTEKTLFKVKKDYSSEFEAMLPFSLTNAQKKAIADCVGDLKKDNPMKRLIQGDVGSGKTAVAASVIYTAVKNGFQCTLMAPTEVLARQHKKTFDSLFADTNINICLLTGNTPAKEKKAALQKIKDGTANIIIGTHAVISNNVEYNNLGLAVTDEQHRFGVNQRAALRSKGSSPHVLVMSATPIPRTLSLIIYGDLDISVLDEKPAGRKPIKTFCVGTDYRKRLYGFVKKQLNEGRQCFIVCPLIENDEDNSSQKAAAEQYAEELKKSEFCDYNTAVLHGKMKNSEKDSVMQRFAEGEIRLLICTVVIEVGIDIPNASVIVIENAECFGLSQLHQLRGRVGRGENSSYCILVSDAQNAAAKSRFDIMCKTNDGFKIADEDLLLRGPGDFFGNRQSGLPQLKIADLMTDTKILYAAKAEAESILCLDFDLSSPEHRTLKEKTAMLFADIS